MLRISLRDMATNALRAGRPFVGNFLKRDIMWINHPTIRPYHNSIITMFKWQGRMQPKPRPLVFVCGGFKSERRTDVEDFISKQHPVVLSFRAESIWESISKRNDSALEMENQLAVISDMVIIIVESPGAIAELGAFAASTNLRKRLLLILDEKRKNEDSFINTGPVRWVEQDSLFGAIYTDYDVVLRSSQEMSTHLKTLENKLRRETMVFSEPPSQKISLFLLADIVGVLGPAHYKD